MTAFESGDVIWVPFPHVESQRMRERPALVVTQRPIGLGGELLWAVMITNALREAWPGDILIEDFAAAGLPILSKIRTAKIATLESIHARQIGRIEEDLWKLVQAQIYTCIEPA